MNGSAKLASLLTPGAPDCKVPPSNENVIAHPEGQLLARTGVRLSDYPYFDRIFWVDTRGNQHIKWEAGRQTSPTYVGDRDYFVETTANRLWQLADARPGAPRFRVDSILSRNTGEYRAVITQHAPAAAICGDVGLGVVSMVTPLLSLIDPILPPDYGFAVVNGDGQVLFHSTGTKNREERFLDEVEDAAELRSAPFARQGRLLTARYLGLDHRLLVTPLPALRDSPWSLIVFHNLSAGASQHLERIVLFSMMTLIYFMVLAAALLVVPAARGPRAWMWPSHANRGAYVQLTLTLAALALPLYLLMFATTRPATVREIETVLGDCLTSLYEGAIPTSAEAWRRTREGLAPIRSKQRIKDEVGRGGDRRASVRAILDEPLPPFSCQRGSSRPVVARGPAPGSSDV